MEFHDNFPQYETMYQHGEEDGKKIRKKLWRVFWVLLGITLLELYVGFHATAWHLTGGMFLKVFFIFFTVAKAAGIVLVFMHLIDETKFFRYIILGPYAIFILYLIYIILVEGTYTGYPENNTSLDKNYKVQQIILRRQHHQPLPESLQNIKLTPEEEAEANKPVSHTATDAEENAAEEPVKSEHH